MPSEGRDSRNEEAATYNSLIQDMWHCEQLKRKNGVYARRTSWMLDLIQWRRVLSFSFLGLFLCLELQIGFLDG